MPRIALVVCLLLGPSCGPGSGGTSSGSSGGTTSTTSSTGTTNQTSTSGSATTGAATTPTTGATTPTTGATTTDPGGTTIVTTDGTAADTTIETTGPQACDAIVGSTDCAALADVSPDLTLEECMMCQGAPCGQEQICDQQYPCVDGIIVLRGCCTDAQCADLKALCGMFIGTNNVCVLNDDV